MRQVSVKNSIPGKRSVRDRTDMRDFFYMPNGFKRGHRGQACILGYCTGTELVVPLGTDHPPRRCKLHISTYLGGGFGMAVVLVVEDEPQVLVLAESCLREHGHKTLSAGSVTQASALLENNDKIDLLFTDIGLKDDLEAGLHLALEAVAKYPGLKVLYTTGQIVTDGMRALFVAKSAMLAKPYTVEQLLTSLSMLGINHRAP